MTPPSGLTTTEAAVLGILRRGELSGYDIRKQVANSVGFFWAPAKTQTYAVLPRLVESGHATRREVVQSRRPDKQVYRITDSGRRALRTWIAETSEASAADDQLLLLRIFFGDEVDSETLVRVVRERRAAAGRLRDQLTELGTRASLPGAGDDLLPSLTRRFGVLYAEAVIRWAEETTSVLEEVEVAAARSLGAGLEN